MKLFTSNQSISYCFSLLNETGIIHRHFQIQVPMHWVLCESKPNVLIITHCNLATFYICFVRKNTEIHK